MIDWQLRIAGENRTCAAFVMLMMIGVAAVTMGGGADLSGRSLEFSKWSGRDLRAANLSHADLTMADLSGADLQKANLSGAKIDRIKLTGADLRGAIGLATAEFGFGISANGANFSGTNLRGARVVGTYFEKANFSNADLTGATLAGRFHGATFDGATVRGTLMLGAGGVDPICESLRSRGAVVVGEDFAIAVRTGRDFSNSFLHGAQLQDLDLTTAKLRGADLHSANLDRTRLNGADLRGTQLYWASVQEAHFDGADMSSAHFDNVRAARASFDGTRLVGATMIGSNLAGANLRNADLTGADLSYADLTGVDLTGTIIDDIAVRATIIENVHGLDSATQRRLRAQAGRWWYDLATGIGTFLQDWSLLLHLTLTPLALVLAVIGFRAHVARTSFAVLAGINIVAIIPLVAGFIFAILGGSPTVQMSEPGLWDTWYHLWPAMMMGLLALFLVSLGAGALHITRYVIRTPRTKWIVSLSCVVLTVANCFFAGYSLVMMAPDA